MAKQNQSKKQHTAASKGVNSIWRFFKQHSRGAIVFFLLGLGGWLIWYSRGCLTDQNKQIAVTKNAWINYRTAEQKFSTDLIALKARGDLYKTRIRSGIASPVAVEQDQKATFELYQLLTADCHALNSSRYQFVLEVREVSRLFSYQWRNFDNLGRSASCEFFADMAEKLRYFSDDPIPSRDKLDEEVKQLDEDLKKLETNIATYVAATEQLDRVMDEAFVKLESKSVARRIIDCF